MRLFFWPMLLLLLSFAPAVTADPAPLSAAFDAIAAGDHKRASVLLKPLARDGVPAAQYLLGSLYGTGQGVDQDGEEAVKWLARAAEQGHYEAAMTLGNMYANGAGIPADAAAAQKWFGIAAQIGVPPKSGDCN